MPNDAILQVRMDSALKAEVEQLYRQMGTTFPEAVRLFAQQSLIQQQLPFSVSTVPASGASLPFASRRFEQIQRASSELMIEDDTPASGFGMFASLADSAKRAEESHAWQNVVKAKHAAGGQKSAKREAGKKKSRQPENL